ncbi:MAG: heavy-metal-associated domain-containing protein [Aureliella sp.]
MKTTFKTNLNCQSCVSKVRPLLDAEEMVHRWQVDTANPDKLLTLESPGPVDVDRIIGLVEKAGFHAEPVDASAPALKSLPVITLPVAGERQNVREATPLTATEKPSFRLSTYRPLLLVVAYIVGLTLYTQYVSGQFHWHEAMRLFMGYFFLAFAFFKLLDVSKFADAFATYDVVAKRSRLYGLTYPWLEAALGIAFLFNVLPLLTSSVTFLIMTVGLVGVVGAVRKKQTIQCACLGTAFNLPMSVVTVIENSVMALMAAVGIWQILRV